jgi:hypothetical protein
VPEKLRKGVEMNIFTLRSKLKSVGINDQVRSEQPIQALTEAPAISVEPVVTDSKEEIQISIPERIGLDQLFELSNTELNAISPRHTFSTLRKPRLSRSFEKPAVTPQNIGLDALLLMDNDTADKLFQK